MISMYNLGKEKKRIKCDQEPASY